MDHQPGRLVDHDQIVVFIDNVQRNILRLRFGWDRSRNTDFEGGFSGRFKAGLADHFPGQTDPAFAHQRLDPFPR
jgi:hypothetical protein